MPKLAGILIVSAALAHAQPPDVFRSETRAVQINVAVKDRNGEPIRKLTQDDFSIFDDGKQRGIQFFSADAEPSAASAQQNTGRLTAIVLDGVNTEFKDQSYARSQAIKAVERMQIDESIAILALTPDLTLQKFTRSRSILLAAINNFRPILPPWPMKQRVQFTLAALKTLAGNMSGAAGRKSIVWLTGGFPPIRSYDKVIGRALNRINDANVALYPIDARGLMFSGAGLNAQTMEDFANATGGMAFYNGNDLSAAIEYAIEDSRSSYTLGFYLNDKERDSRFHTLKVTANHPGSTLRYRRGYTPGYGSPTASRTASRTSP